MNELPNELLEHILVDCVPRGLRPGYRFVCKLWSTIIPPPESRSQRSRSNVYSFLVHAAWLDAFPLFRWAVEEGGCPFDPKASWSSDFTTAAARLGHLPELRWLLEEKGCLWHPDIAGRAASGGHLHILEWLQQEGYPWHEGSDLITNAAKRGRMNVLEWALAQRALGEQFLLSGATGCAKNVETLMWLREVAHLPWDIKTCSGLAANGAIHALKWARENGCPWDHTTLVEAAANDHLHTLQWARESGCPWGPHDEVALAAAKKGRVKILMWLKANGCPWPVDTMCYAAAKHRRVEALRWLITEGCCTWGSTRLAHSAARHGDLRLLGCLLDLGYPFEKDGFVECAVQAGQVKVLQWALDNQKLHHRDFIHVNLAVNNKRVHAYRWLKDVGKYETSAGEYNLVCIAIRLGDVLMVQSLIQDYTAAVPWARLVENAARCGQLETLKYLMQNCKDEHMACSMAASSEHLDVLEWLRESGLCCCHPCRAARGEEIPKKRIACPCVRVLKEKTTSKMNTKAKPKADEQKRSKKEKKKGKRKRE